MLANPKLDFSVDREKVNKLVVNFVIKYLGAYLEVPFKPNARTYSQEIKMIVDFTVLCAVSQVEEAGDVDPASEGGDNYALRCLYDIHQTAAIFKEIVFNDQFRVEDHFFGLDLGSGTGILTVAVALAAKRKGIGGIRVVGVERSKIAVERARKAVVSLGLEKEIEFVCADLLAPGLLDGFLAHSSKLSAPPLSFWVSETISIAIPKFDPFAPGFDLNLKSARGRKSELKSDPFVEVLKATVDAVPDFLESAKAGKIALFPDVVNGLYIPDGNRSKITLKTGPKKPLPLERLGQEFEAYEDLGGKHRRWDTEEGYRD
ncbi:class I SAM-dependent methyltransferase, partial [Candidatus Peregrinibacteria bacterium]|nr:class I SAM-dependent methyltransferase [Candidatus Peregrinibacteria bacterium]